MSSYEVFEDDYLAMAELDGAGIEPSDVLILSRNNLSVGSLDIGDCGGDDDQNGVGGDL